MREIRRPLDLSEMPSIPKIPFHTDRWVPACGGTETPFKSRSGRTLLYCWNPGTGKHAYLDCETDMILSDEDAAAYMQMY